MIIWQKEIIAESEVSMDIPTFSKEQLISAKKYRDKQDVLSVILKDDVKYGFDEIESLINKFMKNEVK